jgi:hypothetical protein
MHLRISDPAYTQRLASFLESLGQTALVAGPEQVELVDPTDPQELSIYLRVWQTMYPEAAVAVLNGDGPT